MFIWIGSFSERRMPGTGLPFCSLHPAQAPSVFVEKGIISFQMGGHLIGLS